MAASSAVKPKSSPFDTGFGSFNELVDQISSTGMKDWMNSQTAGGAADVNKKRNDFIQDCARLRGRLKSRQGFVNPRSTWIQYWDFATTIALLYTATITPYEVCVGLKSEWGVLWGINTFMNLIFMGDIGVQFFLPVLNPETNEFIRDHKILARKYLKSWFVIDVGTVLPFDTLMLIKPDLFGSSSCGSGFTPVKAMKLLRIARLFKLVKILRASRILSRWESSISMSTSSRTLLTAWVGWAVAMHWLACIWLLMPQLQSTFREDADVQNALNHKILTLNQTSCEACICSSDQNSPVCLSPCLTDCEVLTVSEELGIPAHTVRNGQQWMCRAADKGWLPTDFSEFPSTMWVYALAKVLGGLGPLGAASPEESFLVSFNGLAVRISFAVLQGYILRVLTTGNPDEMRYRQKLDALNFMMADSHIPNDVRRSVRDYFRRSKQLVKRSAYYGLIDSSLSRTLRSQMRQLISKDVFKTVWWMQACEPGFLLSLSEHTKREAFGAEETISSVDENGFPRLCILMAGVASRAGNIMMSGATWGDMIISSPMLRDMRNAKALSYVEVVTLSRKGLDEVMAKFPVSAKAISMAALKLATQRTIVVMAMYSKVHGEEKANEQVSSLMDGSDGLGAIASKAAAPAPAGATTTPPRRQPIGQNNQRASPLSAALVSLQKRGVVGAASPNSEPWCEVEPRGAGMFSPAVPPGTPPPLGNGSVAPVNVSVKSSGSAGSTAAMGGASQAGDSSHVMDKLSNLERTMEVVLAKLNQVQAAQQAASSETAKFEDANTLFA